jgi:hypothetical protein
MHWWNDVSSLMHEKGSHAHHESDHDAPSHHHKQHHHRHVDPVKLHCDHHYLVDFLMLCRKHQWNDGIQLTHEKGGHDHHESDHDAPSHHHKQHHHQHVWHIHGHHQLKLCWNHSNPENSWGGNVTITVENSIVCNLPLTCTDGADKQNKGAHHGTHDKSTHLKGAHWMHFKIVGKVDDGSW